MGDVQQCPGCERRWVPHDVGPDYEQCPRCRDDDSDDSGGVPWA